MQAQKCTETTPIADFAVLPDNRYKPLVHVIGGDNLVAQAFRKHGYRVTATSNGAEGPVDMVCFTGGQDIHPRLYDEQVDGARVSMSAHRDAQEVDFYHFYHALPKVGICRGAQLLNVLSGGKMIQDVGHHMGHHDLFDLWGHKVVTSSVHHQMMILPENGQCIGWAKNVAFNPGEKVVEPEVVWFPETQSFGVQGHPEYGPTEFTNYFFRLVNTLILPLIPANGRKDLH